MYNSLRGKPTIHSKPVQKPTKRMKAIMSFVSIHNPLNGQTCHLLPFPQNNRFIESISYRYVECFHFFRTGVYSVSSNNIHKSFHPAQHDTHASE